MNSRTFKVGRGFCGFFVNIYIYVRAGWTAAPRAIEGRKVRAPQGRAPDNVWGSAVQTVEYGKCHRNDTASGFLGVRVKW